MDIIKKVKALTERFSNHLLNRFDLLTSQQVSVLALNKALYGLIPPAFDMDAAIDRLRKDYDSPFSKIVFFNSDTLTPHWQPGQRLEDYPLSQDAIERNTYVMGGNQLGTTRDIIVLPNGVERIKEQVIYISQLSGQNLFDDLKPASTEFGLDMSMRYIFNHEAAHALDQDIDHEQEDIARTIRDESFADTFALLRLATETTEPLPLGSFSDELSKMRSKHALTYSDIGHSTTFVVDALLQNDFYHSENASAETILSTAHEHLEKFLPPADDLRKYDRNLRRTINEWNKGSKPADISFFEIVYQEMIQRAQKQGTEEYDACFIYAAARFYKTYVTEGYAFHGGEQKYGSKPYEQDRAGMKAAFNKAVSTLEQDSHFKKFKIDTLKLG